MTALERAKQESSLLRRHLIRGASGSLVLKVCNTGLGLLLAVVLARLLGVDGFGIYAFCLSLVEILVMPAMLGGNQLLVREVAAYQVQDRLRLLRGLLVRYAQAGSISSLLIALLGAGVGLWAFRDGPMLAPFLLAMALLPLLTAMRLQEATLRGLRHVLLGQVAQNLRPALVLILVGLLIWLTGNGLEVEAALAAQLFGSGVLLLLTLFFLFRVLPPGVKNAEAGYETSRWLKSVLPFVFAGSMQILNRELSVVLLGVLQTPEEVGLFRVAQRGALLIPFGLQAVNMAIAPTVAQMFANGEKKRLQRLLHKSILAVLAYALPVTLILVVGGKPLLDLVFGAEYGPAYTPLVILSLGQLINAGLGSVGLVLNMAGMERYTARGVALAALANGTLNLSLIPFWGTAGAAAASSLSLLIWNVLLFVWLYRKTGLVSTLVPGRYGKTAS